MLKKFLIFMFMINISTYNYANEEMEKYIVDGSLAIYFPNLEEVASTFRSILQKIYGVEYPSVITRLQLLIKDHLSVNILDGDSSQSIGIDHLSPVVFVHIKKDMGYGVFTISNRRLLESVLNKLTIPYRIEGNFVILSSSLEVLEYRDFVGIGLRQEFQQAKNALSFNWEQKFFWMGASYFQERNLSTKTFVIPQGDWIAGAFEVTSTQLLMNTYTIYKDPNVNNLILQSTKTLPPQRLSFLDFESGTPPVIGQVHLNFARFLDMLEEIDILDSLGIQKIFSVLQNKGINLREQLLPYLTGRLSYTIREFNILEQKINLTATAQVNNKQAVFQFIRNLPNLIPGAKNRALFTQNIFGWNVGNYTIWVGLIEDHFLFSTDEESMTQLVQNIYEGRKGFLRTLPGSFRQFVNNRTIGGQVYVSVGEFLQYTDWRNPLISYNFLTTLDTVKWDFYFDTDQNNIGRRDILIFEFADFAK